MDAPAATSADTRLTHPHTAISTTTYRPTRSDAVQFSTEVLLCAGTRVSSCSLHQPLCSFLPSAAFIYPFRSCLRGSILVFPDAPPRQPATPPPWPPTLREPGTFLLVLVSSTESSSLSLSFSPRPVPVNAI